YRSAKLRPYQPGHQDGGDPLRLRESPIVRSVRIAAEKLKGETSPAIDHRVPLKCFTRARTAEKQDHTQQHHKENEQGLDRLHRKKLHTDKAFREASLRVLGPIADAPAGRKSVAAADHQAARAPTSQEQADAENGDIQVPEHGLMSETQEQHD